MASTITPRRELHTGLPIPMPRVQAYPRARKQRLKIESGTLTPVRRIRTAHHLAEIRARLHASSDRKSTRLNSSHRCISYAVFCLKKKNRKTNTTKQHQYTNN